MGYTRNFKWIVLISILFLTTDCLAQRSENETSLFGSRTNFDKDWRFFLGDNPEAKNPDFKDAQWRHLNLPHDWSIEGAFSEDNPAGVGGGALPGGIGWYRKVFKLKEGQSNKSFFIDFDGVYMNSEVWINGHYLGIRPYGYSSFRYEITPYLHFGNEENTIAVRVDNSKQPNSRWYSGSGIYRNVWLVTTNKIHIGHWGTYISTPKVSSKSADVSMVTTVENSESTSGAITLTTLIYSPEGSVVAEKSSTNKIPGKGSRVFSQSLFIKQPLLWSTKKPVLYKAVSEIKFKGKVIDRYITPIGIRTFYFDAQNGFFLNGKHIPINGVCDHHDLGSLGSAVNTRAIQRQLEMLKSMGVNAIRTSHNPPAPEVLKLCDEMGILVMDEAFDCWKKGKNPFDYHLYWDQWHQKDLTDLIRRDRNHPSIIIWSIGNEIPDQWDQEGATIAKELRGIVLSLDTSRPITAAINDPEAPNNSISHSGAVDLIGHNYRAATWKNFFKFFPDGKFVATETTSALETRGMYNMPSDSIFIWPAKNVKMNDDFSCSAYDNCRVPWGNTHEKVLETYQENKFVSGIFVWTGFDYLGEPTPYRWPARSSYFGIIDLAGFPKDAYYLYKSVWTSTPTLHVLPDWNWNKGDTVDVWAYYNDADKVELFLNGKSLGFRQKNKGRLHVMWRVPYQPGILKAVSFNGSKPVLTSEVQTAGPAVRIIMEPDRSRINADGKDLSFVKVKVVDKNGNLVPHADNLIHFNLKGEGFIAGLDNGSEIDHERFKGSDHNAFNGLCLAIIESNGKRGKINLTASADGLQKSTVTINAGE